MAFHLKTMVLSPDTAFALQTITIMGILPGMLFNFLGNRYAVLRKRHQRG